MKYLRVIAGLMLVVVSLMAPVRARACPLCTEMVAAAGDEVSDDSDHFPEAVNQSIYVMVSMPYLCFGVVGFFVYRGVKMNRVYLDALDDNKG